MGTEWPLSSLICVSGQIAFRMVVTAILSSLDLSYTPDELKTLQPKNCCADGHICRSNVQGSPSLGMAGLARLAEWTRWGVWELLWPPPSSPLPTKEEVVQFFSLWLPSYIWTTRTREYSNFLVITIFLGSWYIGKGRMDFKVFLWWRLLVRVEMPLLGTK